MLGCDTSAMMWTQLCEEHAHRMSGTFAFSKSTHMPVACANTTHTLGARFYFRIDSTCKLRKYIKSPQPPGLQSALPFAPIEHI